MKPGMKSGIILTGFLTLAGPVVSAGDCWTAYDACETVRRDQDFGRVIALGCTLVAGEPGKFVIWCPPGIRGQAFNIRWNTHLDCEDAYDLCNASKRVDDFRTCLAGPGDRGWCSGVRGGPMKCGNDKPDQCWGLDVRWCMTDEQGKPWTYIDCLNDNPCDCVRDGRIDLHDFAAFMIRFQRRMDDNRKAAGTASDMAHADFRKEVTTDPE